MLRGKLAVQLVAIVVPGADNGRLIVAGHLLGGIPSRHSCRRGCRPARSMRPRRAAPKAKTSPVELHRDAQRRSIPLTRPHAPKRHSSSPRDPERPSGIWSYPWRVRRHSRAYVNAPALSTAHWWSVCAGRPRISAMAVVMGARAVGTTCCTSAGGAKTLTEHWNGTSWRVRSSPNPSPPGDVLAAVTAVYVTGPGRSATSGPARAAPMCSRCIGPAPAGRSPRAERSLAAWAVPRRPDSHGLGAGDPAIQAGAA